MSSSKTFSFSKRSVASAGLVLSAALAVAACGDAPKPVTPNAPQSPTGSSPTGGMPTAPQSPAGSPAPAGAKIGDPLTSETVLSLLTPEMKTMVEKVKKAQTAYDANKTDAKAKTALVAARLEYGNALRDKGQTAPRPFYAAARKMYIQVLELDAQNKEAMDKKNEIESIYQSMGRPIPE